MFWSSGTEFSDQSLTPKSEARTASTLTMAFDPNSTSMNSIDTTPSLNMAFDPNSTSTLLPLDPQSNAPLPTAVESDDPTPSPSHNEPLAADVDPLLPRVGMEFVSSGEARSFYSAHAERVGFRVRNSKSFTSRLSDAIIMRRFVCSRQGQPSKKDPFDLTKRRRNRTSSREGCHAMLQVINW